ncbi:type I restriction endonuclease subunit R [Oecophyllibacter saccharovorans]|nr:type I restriction endonuclease subunit R [Oecophyllibacter saccharovorans]
MAQTSPDTPALTASVPLEAETERALVAQLQENGYIIRRDIHSLEGLEKNFRHHFEKLNLKSGEAPLSDGEFKRLLKEIITPDVFSAAEELRERRSFIRDDETTLYYNLANTEKWCANSFEVITQLGLPNSNAPSGTRQGSQRHDVTLLLNGLPVCQIELKRHGISPRKALEQVQHYKKQSGGRYEDSLLCFLQMFIAASPDNVWYFANNNEQHFTFNPTDSFLPIYRWALPDNKKITSLRDFTTVFLDKCHFAEMVGLYTILLQEERKLMMMRPYQVYAVQKLQNRVQHNSGNGFIWHTTGSGKTLTSFRAATLMKNNPDLSKVVFVVDRKDLDAQTVKEFNRFQTDCVAATATTNALAAKLASEDRANKVIVTTIQKLGRLLTQAEKKSSSAQASARASRLEKLRTQLAPLAHKRVVFIFDECHRSQFGDNHKAIKAFFPHAQMFGFTGTPIMEENATRVKRETGAVRKTTSQEEGQAEASHYTTRDLFEECLHRYTITDAIEDRNVLGFKVEYYDVTDGTSGAKQTERKAEKLSAEAQLALQEKIAEKILVDFDRSTANRKFNALFAVSSIKDAITYYDLFETLQAQLQRENPDYKPLNIACVFSPPPALPGQQEPRLDKDLTEDLEQERAEYSQDNAEETARKSAALSRIISDYNQAFSTHQSIQEFDRYYRDVQQRIKDQARSDLKPQNKINLTIVVDMMLTGFDSKYLNTLYVDKNLKHHGLIQAFSRTNRVLDGSKPAGNVLDFRNQQENVNNAVALFSGLEGEQEQRSTWLVESAEEKIHAYQQAVSSLHNFMESAGLQPLPSEVVNLKGDDARRSFMKKYSEVQKIANQLSQYVTLSDEQRHIIQQALPPEMQKGFKAAYLETSKLLGAPETERSAEEEAAQDSFDFELELFADNLIDYDFIINLMAAYTRSTEPEQRRLKRDEILTLLKSDAKFMADEALLRSFIEDILGDGKPRTKGEIDTAFSHYRQNRFKDQARTLAESYNVQPEVLWQVVQTIITHKSLEASALLPLLNEDGLSFKARMTQRTEFGKDLVKLLRTMQEVGEAPDDIRGLNHYEIS